MKTALNTPIDQSHGARSGRVVRRGFHALCLAYVLVPQQALAQAADYTYTIYNSTINITKYIGLGGDVTIPSTINGLPVTSIGVEAFVSCASLASVTILSSVAFSGWDAFSGCTNLIEVWFRRNATVKIRV